MRPYRCCRESLRRTALHTLLCAAIVSWLAVAGTARAVEVPETEPTEGLLVLNNGNVLSGEIVRDGKYYFVRVKHGELRVRHTDANFIAADIDDAYHRLRQTRVGSTADSHLELARWCLRLELFDYAEREINDARTIHSSHPKLGMLERQLEQARSALQKTETTTSPSPAPSGATSSAASTPASHSVNDSKLPTAAHKAPLSGKVPLGEIPRWVRVDFVKQIQPMLLNSCATSGCHQPGSSQTLELDRLAMQGVGHPSVVQRNLETTFAQIDRNAPLESPLLIYASTMHGSTTDGESRPFTPKQIKLLRRWLAKMSPRGQANSSELLIDEDQTPDEATATGTSAAAELDEKKAADVDFSSDVLDNKPMGLLPPREVQRGIELKRFEPKDPFDPEIFNRSRR